MFQFHAATYDHSHGRGGRGRRRARQGGGAGARLDGDTGTVAQTGMKPISDFPSGTELTIKELCPCGKMRGRLYALGLTPGTRVVLRNGGGNGEGPCQIEVRGSTLSLGCGVACKLLCAECESCEEEPSQQT